MIHQLAKNGQTVYKNLGIESSLADGTLIAFNSGDRAAFTSVHEALYPNIYYFARRFVNSEEAADITSDAFLKLWKMEKHFQRLQSIKVFLQVTVRNACLNYLRDEKHKSGRLLEMIYLSDTTEEDQFDNEELQAELVRRIYQEIENLPGPTKRILKMSYLDGLKDKKIAELLKISIATVYNQKSKALNLLRLALMESNLLLFSLTFLQLFLFGSFFQPALPQ